MNCNKPVFCDVDDTLVLWNKPLKNPENYVWVEISYEGITDRLVVNTKQVEELRKHKVRGSTIIVWSLAGSAWADAVVKALGIEELVDLTLEKPWILYDDLAARDFMPNSKWFPVPGVKDER